MTKPLIAVALMIFCVLGCQFGGSKAGDLTILNVNDLNDQHKKDKEVLREKYHGKEVVVIGRATDDFDADPVFWETGGTERRLRLAADLSKEVWVGVDCKVDQSTESQFTGIKEDAVVTVRGVFHIVQGGMELHPCSRQIRDSK